MLVARKAALRAVSGTPFVTCEWYVLRKDDEQWLKMCPAVWLISYPSYRTVDYTTTLRS